MKRTRTVGGRVAGKDKKAVLFEPGDRQSSQYLGHTSTFDYFSQLIFPTVFGVLVFFPNVCTTNTQHTTQSVIAAIQYVTIYCLLTMHISIMLHSFHDGVRECPT